MIDPQTLEDGDNQPRDPTDWTVTSNSTSVPFNPDTDSSLEHGYYQPSMGSSSNSTSLPIDTDSMPVLMQLPTVYEPSLDVDVENQISVIIRNTVDERRRHLEDGDEDSTPGCLGIVYWAIAIFMLVFFSMVFMWGFVTLIKDLCRLYGTDEGRSGFASGVD